MASTPDFPATHSVLPGGMQGRGCLAPFGAGNTSMDYRQMIDANRLMPTVGLCWREGQSWWQSGNWWHRREGRVPGIATLENPPGTEEKGSAWALPEIKAFMRKWACEEANFNTCAFQEGKFRWKKPGRFGGRLANLRSLSKICKCPGWITHEALAGPEKTSKAAQYPRQLAKEYAELVVALWKKQLQLEW